MSFSDLVYEIVRARKLDRFDDPISQAIAGRIRMGIMHKLDEHWKAGKTDPEKRAEVLELEGLLPVGYQTYLWAQHIRD